MCGLAGGISSTLVGSERDVIKDLIVQSWYRGHHSTGMLSWSRADKASAMASKKEAADYTPLRYYKSLSDPFQFGEVEYADAEKRFWKFAEPTFIAGHTRSATMGAISKKNAHPFNQCPIYGMHNGTVPGSILNKDKFETDSECIFYNIAKLGLHKTLEDIQDWSAAPAYALVWFDRDKETLNFLRNGQRPLHIATAPTGRTWYWASDKELLEWVFFQNKLTGYKIEALPVNEHKYFQLRDADLQLLDGEPLPHGAKIRTRSIYTTPANSSYKNKSIWDGSAHDPDKYGGPTNPEYYVQYSRHTEGDMYNHKDEVSGKWMTKHQYNETQKWRAANKIWKEAQQRVDDEKDKQDALKKKLQEGKSDPNFTLSPGTHTHTPGIKTSSTTKSRFDKTGEAAKERRVPRPIEKNNVLPLFTMDNPTADFTHSFGYNLTGRCTQAAWFKKVACGCLYCGNPVMENERLFWLDNTRFLCETCIDKVETKTGDAAQIVSFVPAAMELMPTPHKSVN